MRVRTLVDFAIKTEYAQIKEIRGDLCEIGSPPLKMNIQGI
jgi:hypothetical protein